MTDDELVLKWRLQTLLRENVVEVVFTKVDGEQRRMKCTLKSDLLPLPDARNWGETIDTIPKHIMPEDVLPVWDVEKNGFRSFRVSSVIDYHAVRNDEK